MNISERNSKNKSKEVEALVFASNNSLPHLQGEVKGIVRVLDRAMKRFILDTVTGNRAYIILALIAIAVQAGVSWSHSPRPSGSAAHT